TCPFWAAFIKAVAPSWSREFASAPRSSDRMVSERSPRSAASTSSAEGGLLSLIALASGGGGTEERVEVHEESRHSPNQNLLTAGLTVFGCCNGTGELRSKGAPSRAGRRRSTLHPEVCRRMPPPAQSLLESAQEAD